MGRFSHSLDSGPTMKYAKPHLTYEKQLALLQERGLEITDPARAIKDLKRIGYYRLSGYLHPLRDFENDQPDSKQRRRNTFIPGACFDHGVALHDFDRRLSHILLDGLQQIEIGLRVKVGYTLGKRGPLAHLNPDTLDLIAKEPHPRYNNLTRYQAWRKEYDSHQKKAYKGKQEFVQHFESNYDGEVPVWAATEFMSLGCLITLFSLLQKKDRRQISRELGVKDPKVLFGWLRPLNVLRNHCAHANRIWNRPVVFQSDKLNLEMLLSPELLAHLQSSPKTPVDHRIYFQAATISYLLRMIHPDATWPTEFVSMMNTYPSKLRGFGLSPEQSMGFIPEWTDERLWKN